MPIFTYTTLDDPLAINRTFATGVNASGQAVGSYNDAGGNGHGFLYSGGTYTTFDDPDGSVGLDWQLGGFAADPPTSQLVQAMAGFGGGAADDLNAAALSADTSQQPLLTTPQYA